jgi:hypothetical protein
MLALFPAIGIPLCQDPYVEEYLVTQRPDDGQVRLAKTTVCQRFSVFITTV